MKISDKMLRVKISDKMLRDIKEERTNTERRAFCMEVITAVADDTLDEKEFGPEFFAKLGALPAEERIGIIGAFAIGTMVAAGGAA